MMKLIGASLALACLAACVSTTTDAATAAPVATEASTDADNIVKGEDGVNYKIVRTVAAAGDPNEIICRVDNMTGSRVKKHKVCLTRAEWAELADANAKDAFDRTASGGTEYQ